MRVAYQLLRDAFSNWLDDYAPSMGAALAYYTLFSVAPLLLIVISVAGLVFGEDAARGEIMGQLTGLIGADGAHAVEGLLAALHRPTAGTIGASAGVVVLLIGATTVFAELQHALNRIWRAPTIARPNGLWALLRARLLSAGMILGLGFLLMVSLIVSAALAALSKWWSPWFGEGALLVAEAADLGVGLGLLTAIFAMIYKWMPQARVTWRDVWIGAAITSLLFTLGKFVIGLYIGRSGVTSAYGAAASLVALMVWVYWSAQIFLLGAEITWVYAHRHGSRRNEPVPPSPTPPRPVPVPVPDRSDAAGTPAPHRR